MQVMPHSVLMSINVKMQNFKKQTADNNSFLKNRVTTRGEN